MADPSARIARRLDCEPAVVDRLCAALALARGLRDGRAQATFSGAIDDLPSGPALRPFLAREGVDDLDAELARRVGAGREHLAALLDSHGDDLEATLAELIEWAASASPERRAGGQIEIPVGVGDDGVVTWALNRESGDQTNANTRIVGQPGTGKSQFLLHLLASVVARAPVGVLLLDYKGDLTEGFAQAIGATVIKPMEGPIPINPFDLPEGLDDRFAPPVITDAIAAVGRQFGDQQRKLLRDGITAAYAMRPDRAPSARDIARAVKIEFEAQNRGADTVLGLLEEVGDYDLFADRSSMSVDEFLARRWIIDLSGLQTLRDLVAFVMLSWFARHVQSLADSSVDGGLRHLRCVLAIDEAHHYIKRRCAPLLELLRVGRSKGVPVVLASQSLNDFKGMTELEEFLPTTFVLRQGGAPDMRALQGALRVPNSERVAVAEASTRLDQFHALTTLRSDTPAEHLRLHGFRESRWRQ